MLRDLLLDAVVDQANQSETIGGNCRPIGRSCRPGIQLYQDFADQTNKIKKNLLLDEVVDFCAFKHAQNLAGPAMTHLFNRSHIFVETKRILEKTKNDHDDDPK